MDPKKYDLITGQEIDLTPENDVKDPATGEKAINVFNPKEYDLITGKSLTDKDYELMTPSLTASQREGMFASDVSQRSLLGSQDIKDYTDYGVPLGQNLDWNEIRARNQSTAEQWGRGLAKAGVTTVGAVAENTIGVAAGIISLSKGEGYYDNAVGRVIDDANNWMRENMPNYRTNAEIKGSLLSNLGTANFWADTVANGLGYSLGSIATMYLTGGVGLIGMTGKAIGAASKGLGMYRAAKAITTGTKLANTLAKGSKIGTRALNAAKMADVGFMMALAESSVEARETKNSMIESLKEEYIEREGLFSERDIPASELQKIEEIASSAGNTNFLFNLAITGGTNALMFGKMAMGFKGSTKTVKGLGFEKSADKALGKAFDKVGEISTRRKVYERLKTMGINALEETAQEAGQFASNIYSSDIHMQRYKDGGIVDKVQALERAFSETFGSKEGRESMLVGAIVGGIMGSGGLFKKSKLEAEQEQRQNIVNLVNDFGFNNIEEAIKDDNLAGAIRKSMEVALAEGDMVRFKDLQASYIQTQAYSALELGGYDVLVEKLEDSKNLEEQEFMQMYGYATEDADGNPLTLADHTDKSQEQVVAGLRDKLNHVKKIYNNVNDIFPLPDRKKGLARLRMSPQEKEAEGRAYERMDRLRRELAISGYSIADHQRRMDSILDNLQNLIKDDPLLKDVDISDVVAKIKAMPETELSEETPDIESALVQREEQVEILLDTIYSRLDKNPLNQQKAKQDIDDYKVISKSNAIALDRYNKLASDPYYRQAFQEEVEGAVQRQKQDTINKQVNEALEKAQTSEELEKIRPNSDTLNESQKEALRKRKKELRDKEKIAKQNYLADVSGMSKEKALETLKEIKQDDLAPTDAVGLRNAIKQLESEINSSSSNLGKDTAEEVANAAKTSTEEGIEYTELDPKKMGGLEKADKFGRNFVIDGVEYVNDKENIQDAIKRDEGGEAVQITLKRKDSGDVKRFTALSIVDALEYQILTAEVLKAEAPVASSVEEVSNAAEYLEGVVRTWKDGVTTRNRQEGRNDKLSSQPNKILRQRIYELVTLKDLVLNYKDTLEEILIQMGEPAENIKQNADMKRLTSLSKKLASFISPRRTQLKGRGENVEPTVEDLSELLDDYIYELSQMDAALDPEDTAGADIPEEVRQARSLLLTKINRIEDEINPTDSVEDGVPTPGSDPGQAEGQDSQREAPGTAEDTTPEQAPEDVNPQFKMEFDDADAPDPNDPGQIDNDMRPPRDYSAESNDITVGTFRDAFAAAKKLTEPAEQKEGAKETIKDYQVPVKREVIRRTADDGSYVDYTVTTNLDGSLKASSVSYDENGNELERSNNVKLVDENVRKRDGLTALDAVNLSSTDTDVVTVESTQSGTEFINPKKIDRLTPEQRKRFDAQTGQKPDQQSSIADIKRRRAEELDLMTVSEVEEFLSSRKILSLEEDKMANAIFNILGRKMSGGNLMISNVGKEGKGRISFENLKQAIVNLSTDDYQIDKIFDMIDKMYKIEGISPSSVEDKINAKYDAELAALGQKPAQQPSSKFDFESMKDTDSYFWDFDGSAHFGNVTVYGKDHGDTKMSQKQDGTPFPMDKGSFQSKTFTTKQLLDAVSAKDKKVVNALVKEIKATIGQTPPQQPSQPQDRVFDSLGQELVLYGNEIYYKDTEEGEGGLYEEYATEEEAAEAFKSLGVPAQPSSTPKIIIEAPIKRNNDATFMVKDGKNYYAAVDKNGDLQQVGFPVEVDGEILIPKNDVLVKAKIGDTAEFRLGTGERYYKEDLEGKDPNSVFEKMPIHIYIGDEFVGRLEGANGTNQAERQQIIKDLTEGKTVTRQISNIVATNPNYARVYEKEINLGAYFSDPRTVIENSTSQPLRIAAVSVDRGVLSLEAKDDDINNELAKMPVSFDNLLPGSIVMIVPESQVPGQRLNFIKANTRKLDEVAKKKVLELFKNEEMEAVKDIVANSPASDSEARTYLNFDTFGESGDNFIVFNSPSLGVMIRVNESDLAKALKGKAHKVGAVKYDTAKEKYVRVTADLKGYKVAEDLANFLDNKKYQVDVAKANQQLPFTDKVTNTTYNNYQTYLFNALPNAELKEGYGHASILSLDVIEAQGSIFNDIGITFDRVASNQSAASSIVQASRGAKSKPKNARVSRLKSKMDKGLKPTKNNLDQGCRGSNKKQ